MPLCFAYGSNLDAAAMAARCPASRAVGPARLPGRRLAIMREGWLTVVPDGRGSVHGLLWDVAFADLPALDRYEEVGSGLYARRRLPVVTGAGPRTALVYVGRNAGPGVPRPGYLENVVAAAGAAGLPAAHVRTIESLSPALARAATGVTPRRRSPFDPDRDPNAGWRWIP